MVVKPAFQQCLYNFVTFADNENKNKNAYAT